MDEHCGYARASFTDDLATAGKRDDGDVESSNRRNQGNLD